MSVQSVEKQVVNAVETAAKDVVQEVQQLFVIERNHLQSFLNYLSKKPYDEVFELVERMKTARVAPAGTVPGEQVTVSSVPPQQQAPAPAATTSDAGVTSSS